MFERWRQENFFKYLREEFLLDALTDYQVGPDDPTRTVSDPQRCARTKELRTARDRLAGLLARRRVLPERVEVRDVSDGAVVKLATERKHLTNLIKMLAFQAESDLLAFLRPHYARSDEEGRTLLHELFRAAADIEVTDAELRVA